MADDPDIVHLFDCPSMDASAGGEAHVSPIFIVPGPDPGIFCGASKKDRRVRPGDDEETEWQKTQISISLTTRQWIQTLVAKLFQAHHARA